MLKDSKLLVTLVAEFDESKVEPTRRAILALLDRAVRVARALRVLWIATGVSELALATASVYLLREPNGAFGTASVTFGVIYFVLLLLISALVWALSLVAGLPSMVDAVAEAASQVIVDAKADYAAISERRGWLGSLHTLWAAGKILRKTFATLQEHEGRIRGLEIIVPLISPAGWVAMLTLAVACIITPMVAMTLLMIRWFST